MFSLVKKENKKAVVYVRREMRYLLPHLFPKVMFNSPGNV